MTDGKYCRHPGCGNAAQRGMRGLCRRHWEVERHRETMPDSADLAPVKVDQDPIDLLIDGDHLPDVDSAVLLFLATRYHDTDSEIWLREIRLLIGAG